jgi:hypothetical protein
MGHTRLGSLPKSEKWSAIVAALNTASSATTHSFSDIEIGDIARQVLDAANAALDRAISDPGVRLTMTFLAELGLNARPKTDQEHLNLGHLPISDAETATDLVVRLQSMLDDRLTVSRSHSDLAEIAQRSAGDALSAIAFEKSGRLFADGTKPSEDFFRTFGTKRGFSRVGHEFFASFLGRFLNFYLSRVTPHLLSSRRLGHVGALQTFESQLRHHCAQTALIVRDYSGAWFSKTAFKGGGTPANAERFLAVALKKLRSELARQRNAQ